MNKRRINQIARCNLNPFNYKFKFKNPCNKCLVKSMCNTWCDDSIDHIETRNYFLAIWNQLIKEDIPEYICVFIGWLGKIIMTVLMIYLVYIVIGLMILIFVSLHFISFEFARGYFIPLFYLFNLVHM